MPWGPFPERNSFFFLNGLLTKGGIAVIFFTNVCEWMVMATLKDIADRTGFSVAVVSRALNPHPDQKVAESTRRSVEEACRALGYRRNHAASCLRRGRHSAIGIFLPGLAGELTARLLDGLTKVANACNFSCNISFGEDIGEYRTFIEQAESLQSVGIISYAPIFRCPGDETAFFDSMERFRSSGGEVLMLNQPADFLPGVGSVCIDNYHSGRLAAEHLIQCGCKRFCLVASSGKYWQGGRRNAGFIETLALQHIPVDIFTVSGPLPARPEFFCAAIIWRWGFTANCNGPGAAANPDGI